MYATSVLLVELWIVVFVIIIIIIIIINIIESLFKLKLIYFVAL